MQDIVGQFLASVPKLVGALVILIVGLIIAAIIANVVRSVLRRSGADKAIARRVVGPERAKTVDIAPVIGRVIFYLILLFVLVLVFQALGLTLVVAPLLLPIAGLLAFLPNLFAAVVLIVIAWVLATLLRTLVTEGLRAVHIDRRVGQEPGNTSLSRSLGEVVYYLVFLFFLPTILEALHLTGLLAPVQGLIAIILGFVPRLISAAVILIIGLFVARLVRGIVTNLLSAAGTDRFGERVGLSTSLGGQGLSGTIGLVVYVLILLPVITAALDALQLSAVTQPVSSMLTRILDAIPNIFAAALTLVIAFVIGRIVGNLIASILRGLGFDRVLALLGLRAATAESHGLSDFVGTLVHAAIVYFALLAALNLLGFVVVVAVLTGLLTLLGHIFLGLIIFAIALWLSRLAADAVRASSGGNSGLLATIARGAVLVLGGAIALRQMGIADEIINLAFGLLLGSIAVAATIAFGIGGRTIAGRELERFVTSLHANTPNTPAPTLPPTSPTAQLGETAPGTGVSGDE